jgi:hypothetical protein
MYSHLLGLRFEVFRQKEKPRPDGHGFPAAECCDLLSSSLSRATNEIADKVGVLVYCGGALSSIFRKDRDACASETGCGIPKVLAFGGTQCINAAHVCVHSVSVAP